MIKIIVILFFLLIITVIIIIIASKNKIQSTKEKPKKDIKTEKKIHFKLKKYLLSKTENNFFLTLRQYTNNQYIINCKVRMEDVIQALDFKDRGYIKSRHIDFIICDPKTAEILMAIELDDKSHNTEQAKKADEFKNTVAQETGLRFARIQAKESYTKEDIETLFK